MSISSSFCDEPPSLAMDPSESSSKRNSSSGDEPSSASMDTDDHSSDAISNNPSGDDSSSASMDTDDHVSDAIVNITSVDEPSVVPINPPDDSEDGDVDIATGFRCDEMIFEALSETYYEPDGIGLDIEEIFDYIEERQELPEYFRERLIDELGELILVGQILKVGDRYKISHNCIPNATKSEESSNQSHSAKLQDQPSTSSLVPTSSEENPDIDAAAKPSTSSSGPTSSEQNNPDTDAAEKPSTSLVPTSSEQNPDIDAAATPTTSSLVPTSSEEVRVAQEVAKALVASDHADSEVVEASRLCDTSLQLLDENETILDLAKELLSQCINGEKVVFQR